MEPAIRGSLSPSTNKSRTRAAESHLQAQVQEKKMSELEVRLNKIWKAKMDEYHWSRYWIEFKKWAFPNRT